MNTHPAQNIGQWLKTPEAQALIRRIAAAIIRTGLKSGCSGYYFPAFLFPDTISYDSEDICSELTLFMLENEDKLLKIIVSGNKNYHHYLKKLFINHQIARIRKPARDARRYLYKRAADILRDSENFHMVSEDKNALAFGMTPESIAIPPLCSEDLEEIAFPVWQIPCLNYECINRKKVLLDLAAYFWNQISKMWGNPRVRVVLKDFITWIAMYVSLPMPMKSVPDEKYSGKNSNELLPYAYPASDGIYFNPILVRKWAGNFANRLNEKEKAVFLMRHGDGLGLKNIAEKMGYKGSSGPKYPLENAEYKLKSFLRDLPWLSPDDFNPEAFVLFHDTLIECLDGKNC